MTKEEYKIKIDALKKRYEDSLKELAIEFAKSNSNVKVGDIVGDHIGKICVEKISFAAKTYNWNFPTCVYYGAELRKDLVPKKNGAKRNVFQCNLIS